MSQKFHRVDYPKHVPDAFRGLYAASTAVHNGVLGKEFLELIFLRVSQINGCAFCVAMHVPLARKYGLSENQINLAATWKEAPVFDPRQRAALAWAEAVTALSGQEVPDAIYEEVKAHFSPVEIANLTLCVVEINGWNRLMVASRTPPLL